VRLDWAFVARDGAILAVVACVIVAGLLRLNPRLFLRHFPAEARARLAPRSPAERRQSLAGGLLLLGWIVGFLIWSTAAAQARGADPASLVIHAFLVGMAFNLADWLILDEFMIGVLRPGWLVVDGLSVRDMPFEHARHFRGFLVGTLGFALVGGLAGAGVAIF
jgi:hypothetical protein